jgi:hypothetical protein
MLWRRTNLLSENCMRLLDYIYDRWSRNRTYRLQEDADSVGRERASA